MLTVCLYLAVGLGVLVGCVLACRFIVARSRTRPAFPARRIIELNPDFIQKA
jgi:hypothetical protein